MNESMLSLVLLGYHGSGKTTLARRIFKGCAQTRKDEDLLEFSTNTENTSVAEVCADTFDALRLGQKLARKTVPAVVVTMPRNEPSALTAQKWVQIARDCCPLAKVALVITKNDLNAASQHSQHSQHSSSRSTLKEHLFDGIVYDAMQAADGVDRLFYTSNTTGQGLTGLRAWMQDVALAHRHGTDFTHFGGHGRVKRKKNRFSKKYRACAAEGCDSCALQ